MTVKSKVQTDNEVLNKLNKQIQDIKQKLSIARLNISILEEQIEISLIDFESDPEMLGLLKHQKEQWLVNKKELFNEFILTIGHRNKLKDITVSVTTFSFNNNN